MHTCQHTENKDFAVEKKYRLADFFNMHWNQYCKQPKEFIKPEQYKAVNAILVCETEVLGVDHYVCPECGDVSEVRHCCKHRFCPNCSWKDTIKWAEKIKQQMLDIPHRHVVFTLPHSLNGLVKKNKKEMINILARTAADTIKDWMKAKHGIKPGIVMVIHTYGEKKNAHYHVHMLVSWGGINFKTGELVALTGAENEYVNYDFIKKKFRCKYQDELIALFDKKELKHGFINRVEFMRFLKKINEKNWHIHFEPPMECIEAVIRYIGRYSKRACLSEYKITNIEGEFISFSYKDYTDRVDPKDKNSPAKEKELTLHYRDFFPLLLQHVPPPYFRLVRYYGVYARFKTIPQEYKADFSEEKLSEIIETEYKTSEDNPKYCRSCTCAKIYVHTIIDKRKKQDRNQPFDIEIHKHIIYKKIYLLPDDYELEKAA